MEDNEGEGSAINQAPGSRVWIVKKLIMCPRHPHTALASSSGHNKACLQAVHLTGQEWGGSSLGEFLFHEEAWFFQGKESAIVYSLSSPLFLRRETRFCSDWQCARWKHIVPIINGQWIVSGSQLRNREMLSFSFFLLRLSSTWLW